MRKIIGICGTILLGATLGCLINWCWREIIPYLIQTIFAGLGIMLVTRRIKRRYNHD